MGYVPETVLVTSMEHIIPIPGVGRLIAEASVCPLVIPFYHLGRRSLLPCKRSQLYLIGMDSVLPNVEPYKPEMGQKVSIYIGEPLVLDELVAKMKQENQSLVHVTHSVQ